MASVPYPYFQKDLPADLDTANNRVALPAVGRCRIDPLSNGTTDAFRAIVDKNKEQARVEIDNESMDESEKKTLKKKYMKEGVAMAVEYLTLTLGLDVSVIDVEILMSSSDIVETDGCIAACFLDAGCQSIVLPFQTDDEASMTALDAAKIPKERLIADLGQHTSNQDVISAISKLNTNCHTVSIRFMKDITEERLSSLLNLGNKDVRVVGQVDPASYSGDNLPQLVGTVCKSIKGGLAQGTICLLNPTAEVLGLSFAACMKTDRPDGLYTTVVCTRSGEALGLVYSSKESMVAALQCGRGVYYSRSRGGLWRKGDTSGHFQTLHRLDIDCDGDALRFTVTQRGDDQAAFCHLNTLTCWGPPRGLRHLEETLQERLKSAPEGSYTKRLFEDADLLRDKLVEEAQELAEADTRQHVAEELADVLYFAMTRATKAGVSIDDAIAELDRRTRKVTRRKGDSKAFRIAAGQAILEKSKDT